MAKLKLRIRNLLLRILPFLVVFIATAGSVNGNEVEPVAWDV